MEQIYDLNLWGGSDTPFYSGDGSHNPIIVDPYIKSVKAFLQSFGKPISICDLGCGDFNIGRQLLEFTSLYQAIDIVEALINYNATVFIDNRLSFQCLDIAKNDLPSADCVIIRQVLQHLSNSEISNIVSKIQKYQYIILTEHLPNGDFVPNLDIISGQGIRLKKKSGVMLTSAPFNLKPVVDKKLCSIELSGNKGVIETRLYEMW
ncbi:MAG: class I SAM-dependent methyltransferase [Nonlabens sp.]